MKVFKSFFKLVYSLGFVFLIVIISYIIASFSYYSHEVGTSSFDDIVLFENDKIIEISAKNSNYITLEIETKEKQSSEFLINYALNYFDKYKKIIYLYDYTYPVTLVTIDMDGEGKILYV